MKNIHRNKSKFQIFLDAVIFIYRLFFGIEPNNEIENRMSACLEAERFFSSKKRGILR